MKRKVYIKQNRVRIYMPSSFNDSMGEYLESRRRKKLFSGFKSDVMNKKSAFSNNAVSKFSELRGGIVTRFKQVKSPEEKPKREIRQGDIDELLRQKGVVDRPIKKIEKRAEEGDGWKEVSLEVFGVSKEETKEGVISVRENTEIQIDDEGEKEPIVKAEPEEKDNEIILANQDEKMMALKKRVSDILFKKKEAKESVKVPEFRRNVLPESIREQPKHEEKKADPVQDEVKKEEAKKSFIAKFVSIGSSSDDEKEREEKLKQEEAKAVRDHIETEQRLKEEAQKHSENAAENVDFSNFFQEDEKIESVSQNIEQVQEGETEEEKKIRELMENGNDSS